MRIGSVMYLRPGCEAAYEEAHRKVWPELLELLGRYGIRRYSIYRYGLLLFSYLEVDDPDRLEKLAHEPLMRRWWDGMQPLMVTWPDHAPYQQVLPEVFHMD